MKVLKKTLVPELRFPQFSGEWKIKELDNIIEISKDKYNPIKDEENYKCIELENLSQETGIVLGYHDSKEQLSTKNKFKVNDILFGKLRPYLKKYWYADFDGVCSSEIWVFRGKKGISNNYVHKLIQTYKFNYIANVSSGSKMPRADWSYMKEIPFGIPSIKEQEKMANFLTLIDNKIEKQEEKVFSLEEDKSGMMQKLFSWKIRFKDENKVDYPNWEWKNLGNILVEENIKCKDRDYEVISSTIKGLYYQKDYFNKDIASSDKSSYKILKKNQIVFSPQNLWMGNINFNDSIEIGIVSPSYKIYDIRKEYCPEFIGYIIKTPYMLHQYLQSSEQGASVVRRNLNLDLFNLIKVKVPSLPEQTKIANFLTSIDTKIEKEREKLESIKELKKGLMQKMFI